MCRVLFGAILLITSCAVAVQAEEKPDPFQALTGRWQRPWVDGKYSPAVLARDGVNMVTPELICLAGDRPRSLIVGGSPPLVYWSPLPYDSHALVTGDGLEKGLLFIVDKRNGGRKLRFEYTLNKETLTITCREKVRAGYWLGDHDISGTWVRFKGTYK